MRGDLDFDDVADGPPKWLLDPSGPAYVARVYDGDTIYVNAPLNVRGPGGIPMRTGEYHIAIRILWIDTPELKSSDPRETAAGCAVGYAGFVTVWIMTTTRFFVPQEHTI